MKAIGLAVVVAMALWLQYAAWFSYDGLLEARRLAQEIQARQNENMRLTLKNRQLRNEVRELKENPERTEALARRRLLMIKPGEVFVLPKEDS